MTRSTVLVWSAEESILPKNCDDAEVPGTMTTRSRSFTSCFWLLKLPGGSVHTRAMVRGILDREGSHVTLNAEAVELGANVPFVYSILYPFVAPAM